MAEQIAKTMLTLAEDNKDMRISLRLMLKYEIQSLLDRLAELGEDSLLILGNRHEETCLQLGTSNGEKFLQTFYEQQNKNLKEEFLKFCCGNQGRGNWNLSVPGGTADQPVPNFLSQSAGFPSYGNQMSNNSRIHGPQNLLSLRHTPYSNPHSNREHASSDTNAATSSLPEHIKNRKTRNACRHFTVKGYCWQGANCAFLHTRDPNIINEVNNSQQTAVQDTTVEKPTTSSDTINNTEQQS